VVASGTAAAQQEGTATATPSGTTTAGGNATATGNVTGTPGDGTAPGGGNATGTATGNASAGGGGGGTVTVDLVDYAFNPGTDSPLTIPPGTTVNFDWQTGGHNIHVDTKPSGSDWQGHEPIEDAGFSTSFTFQTEGKFHFWCVPHKSLGMVGDIEVKKGAPLPGQAGAGGPTEVDPEEMGVPFQAHFVGLATLLGVFVTLVFTFFFLKYGETPHSGYPEEK